MKGLTPREDRRAVRLEVRVRTDSGWSDAVIANVSSKGVMLRSLAELRRNQVIEIARGNARIIGRIVWSNAGRSGIAASDKIDLEALSARRPHRTSQPEAERRSKPRSTPLPSQHSGERSRELGRRIEWLGLVAGVALGAGTLASFAYETLSTPVAAIGSALGGYRSAD